MPTKKLNYPLFRTEHYHHHHHHRRYCFVGSTCVQSYEFGPKLQQNFALQWLVTMSINLLNPTGYVMQDQFNIQQL